MTRAQLEHAIRAACDVSGDREVWVFGSQAILGEHPDAPSALRRSIEVDIAPRNHPERVDAIDGVLGELSTFHQTHDFYVHGVPIDTAQLPAGWQVRTYRLQNHNTRQLTGWCVEGHDLAASKLAAFRDKDRDFVRVLLVERLIDADVLLERVALMMELEPEPRERMERWIHALRADLSDSAP
ncbi:DUF6036 family nucleotidyltransferase [Longimicrobium sp.]|uniref:DUF6036 family nucleotidyltransferase n=1 Tax=Longimicrobium sp. TaxID=2029185 RepID=UPI002E37ECAB|nr:DUF6036 family nucleotidyltransferase [Longimicrobium sp.]HEX6038578.1 DUF6036 family nucleotidyltransferase [Longimicrobium sp.]